MAIGSLTIKYTHDDRGQKILFRGMRELGRQAALDPQAATIMDRATSFYLSRMPTKAIMLASIVNMFVVMILVFRFHWAWAVLCTAVFVILMQIVIRKKMQKTSDDLADIFVNEGVCAGCAYPLEGLGTDGDGFIRCPECSASWQRDRIVRFASIAKALQKRGLLRWGEWLLLQMGRGYGKRSIEDDRGVVRTAAAIRSLRRAAKNAGTARGPRLTSAVKAVSRQGRAVRWGLAFVFLINVVVQGNAMRVRLTIGSLTVQDLPLIGVLLLFSLFFVVALTSDAGRKGKEVRKVLLTHGLCASCIADLEGVEPADDGCTVCTACGSAWKLGGAEEQR